MQIERLQGSDGEMCNLVLPADAGLHLQRGAPGSSACIVLHGPLAADRQMGKCHEKEVTTMMRRQDKGAGNGKMGWRLWAVLGLSALLGACGGSGGGEDRSAGSTKVITAYSPAEIAQSSADNYEDNVNGMITGARLKSWVSNWPANRPAGITGKLVIFQATVGPTGAEYIKPNNLNVFTYLSPSSEWIQTRSNGVILTQSMVPDGPTMDALLKKYGVDPHNDMLVCAMGTGSTGNAMAQGRCWYALRYWGVRAANLALLNGGNQWLNGNGLAATDFAATASTAPNSGTVSVKTLLDDNTALQATMEDLLAVLPADDRNLTNDGVMIWDARSAGQFSAGERLEPGEGGFAACGGATICAAPADYDYMRSFQNSGSRQGHPRGTLQLQFTNMLDASKGFAYKPKAAIRAYMDGATDASGYALVDGSYQRVGAGAGYQPGDTVYTYCETTFRAMITGMASAVIMGYPTRFYDGAMVEWNSLSHLPDAKGNNILPADSPWRTDVKSFFRAAKSASQVAERTIVNPYATHANQIILEGQSYKQGSSSGSGGGGSVNPGNPCGG